MTYPEPPPKEFDPGYQEPTNRKAIVFSILLIILIFVVFVLAIHGII